jgi:hypothetical protein
MRAAWILSRTVRKLVVVVSSIDTNQVLERWVFHLACDPEAKENECGLPRLSTVAMPANWNDVQAIGDVEEGREGHPIRNPGCHSPNHRKRHFPATLGLPVFF